MKCLSWQSSACKETVVVFFQRGTNDVSSLCWVPALCLKGISDCLWYKEENALTGPVARVFFFFFSSSFHAMSNESEWVGRGRTVVACSRKYHVAVPMCEQPAVHRGQGHRRIGTLTPRYQPITALRWILLKTTICVCVPRLPHLSLLCGKKLGRECAITSNIV